MARKPRPPIPPIPAKKTGRKRRLTSWTLITLGLLVAGMWVASGWWGVTYSTSSKSWLIGRGIAGYGSRIQYTREGWEFGALGTASWNLWWRWYAKGSASYEASKTEGTVGVLAWKVFSPPGSRFVTVVVVLWPVPLLLWLTAAPVLRSGILARRQVMKGMCTKCGYSLVGLAEGATCPECGKGAATA